MFKFTISTSAMSTTQQNALPNIAVRPQLSGGTQPARLSSMPGDGPS